MFDAAAVGGSARFSDDGRHRYVLGRRWSDVGPTGVFVMLNPSTADADVNDRTIRRCIGFAQSWGWSGIHVLNLFALRSPYPSDLLHDPNPVGPANNDHLVRHARAGLPMIAAWGGHSGRVQKLARARAAAVCAMMIHVRWRCLGTTKDGDPRHPLYLAADDFPTFDGLAEWSARG